MGVRQHGVQLDSLLVMVLRLVEFTGIDQCAGKVSVIGGVFPVGFQRQPKAGLGLVDLLCGLENRAKGVVRFAIDRIVLYGLERVLECLGVAVLPEQNRGKISMPGRQRGFDTKCAAVGRLRFGQAIGLLEYVAKVQVRLGQVGFGGDGILETTLRLAKRLVLAMEQAEVDLGLSVARIKLHSLLVMVLRLVGVTGFLVKQTKRKLQIRVVWRQFAGFLKAQIGRLQRALGDQVESLKDQRSSLVECSFRTQAGRIWANRVGQGHES